MVDNKGRASWMGDPRGSNRCFYSYYEDRKEEFDKENFEFEEELKYQYITRGRSAARALFKDQYDNQYEMFASDFTPLIHQIGDVRKVLGKWTFRKQGRNVGLVYLGEINGD